MVVRLILTLFVVAGLSGEAWAQSVQTTQQTVATDETKVGKLTQQRAQAQQRYQDQLAAVDRLKKQKASWRRDRELRESLAESADTANELATLNTQLATATRTLVQARKDLVAAIDREKPTATGARATELDQLRAKVTSSFGPAPKKIVLPDAEVDPLADPEELDQQAQVIAETEKQLANEVAGLDSQATELAHVADLRKHNDRAKELMLNDDDSPRRNQQHSSSGEKSGGDSAPASLTPTNGGASGTDTGAGGTFTGAGQTASFETEATFVLGEVVDHSTIDSLTRAQRSGDPAKRAEAARLARDAVSQRLDTLKKKRAQIEARAKQLRAKK